MDRLGNRPVFPSEEGDGITLRQLFAGMAMVGLLANPTHDYPDAEYVSSVALAQADALLCRLEVIV